MRLVGGLLGLFLATPIFAEKGGSTGGGGGIETRILLARLYACDVLARAETDTVSKRKKDLMRSALDQSPIFSKPGEKVYAKNEQGEAEEVSASYEFETNRITFNVERIRQEQLTITETVALYLV